MVTVYLWTVYFVNKKVIFANQYSGSVLMVSCEENIPSLFILAVKLRWWIQSVIIRFTSLKKLSYNASLNLTPVFCYMSSRKTSMAASFLVPVCEFENMSANTQLVNLPLILSHLQNHPWIAHNCFSNNAVCYFIL